jgi:hypothetical protein
MTGIEVDFNKNMQFLSNEYSILCLNATPNYRSCVTSSTYGGSVRYWQKLEMQYRIWGLIDMMSHDVVCVYRWPMLALCYKIQHRRRQLHHQSPSSDPWKVSSRSQLRFQYVVEQRRCYRLRRGWSMPRQFVGIGATVATFCWRCHWRRRRSYNYFR